MLEEFLNEEYLEIAANDMIENNVTGEITPIELLESSNDTKKYFYIPSEEGIGGLRYIVNSDGNAIYLIKKSGLPDEIRKQLNGGEAGDKTYQSYVNMIDVYGVTSDLHVYYCTGGIDSIKGVDVANLDNDNPLRTVIGDTDPEFSSLASFDKDSDGKISSTEVRGITNLTIDNSSSSSNLNFLYKLPSLESLIIRDKNLTNLDGIQNCPYLTSVYFRSCTCSDYSKLGFLQNILVKLYFYNIDDNELNTICNNELGIASFDFNELLYFGIFGNEFTPITYDIWSSSFLSSYSGGRASKSITTTEPLSNFSNVTKQTIKYLWLNNNKISSLSGLIDFNNVYSLRAETNYITNLSGLEKMKNLAYLNVANNYLGKNEIYNGSTEISEQYSDTDALHFISELNKLYYIRISENTNLKYVKYLKNCTGLRVFYGYSVTNLVDAYELKTIKAQCNPFYLDQKYELDLLDSETTKSLDLHGKKLTVSNLTSIKECTKIYRLNLRGTSYVDINGNALSESVINTNLEECLNSLTLMQYLDLRNINSLTTINFTKKMPELRQMLLTGTKVADLAPLDSCTKLNSLLIDYSTSSSTLTASTIKRCCEAGYRNWRNWSGYDYWDSRRRNRFRIY